MSKPVTKPKELQKVLQSKGDVGVPKILKKPTTSFSTFNFSAPRKRKSEENVEPVKVSKNTPLATPKTSKLPPKPTPSVQKPVIARTPLNVKPTTVNKTVPQRPLAKGTPIMSKVLPPKSPSPTLTQLKERVKDQEDTLKNKEAEIVSLKTTQQGLEDEIKELKEKITTLESQLTRAQEVATTPEPFSTTFNQIEISGFNDSNILNRNINLDEMDTPKEKIPEVEPQAIHELVIAVEEPREKDVIEEESQEQEIKIEVLSQENESTPKKEDDNKTPMKLRKRKLIKKNAENDLDRNTFEKN